MTAQTLILLLMLAVALGVSCLSIIAGAVLGAALSFLFGPHGGK